MLQEGKGEAQRSKRPEDGDRVEILRACLMKMATIGVNPGRILIVERRGWKALVFVSEIAEREALAGTKVSRFPPLTKEVKTVGGRICEVTKVFVVHYRRI